MAAAVNAASLRRPAPDDPPAFPSCPMKGWYSQGAGVPSPLSDLVSRCFGQHPPGKETEVQDRRQSPPAQSLPRHLGQMVFVLTSDGSHPPLTLAPTQSSRTRSKAARAQAGPGQPLPPSPTVCPLLPRLTEAVPPFRSPRCCGTSLLSVCSGVRSLLPRVRRPRDSVMEYPVLSCPGSLTLSLSCRKRRRSRNRTVRRTHLQRGLRTKTVSGTRPPGHTHPEAPAACRRCAPLGSPAEDLRDCGGGREGAEKSSPAWP